MTSNPLKTLLKFGLRWWKNVTWNASKRAHNLQLSQSSKSPASVLSSSMAFWVFGAAGARLLESRRPTAHLSPSSSSLVYSSLAQPCSSLHTPWFAPNLSHPLLARILCGRCMTIMTWSWASGARRSSGCSHSWSLASAAPTPAPLKSNKPLKNLGFDEWPNPNT